MERSAYRHSMQEVSRLEEVLISRACQRSESTTPFCLERLVNALLLLS